MTRKLMVRFDDITADMNWELFYKTLDLLQDYGVKPLLGVVPDNQDVNLKIEEVNETFYDVVREFQSHGYIIAMHGYHHCYETKSPGVLGINQFSEFAGLSYENQYHKLKNAKEIFDKEKINTKIFMAPGHSYDKNTLKALKALEFQYITDGLIARSYKREGLIHIPCTLRTKLNPKGVDTICIHTNSMTEENLKWLNNLLERNGDVLCDFTLEGWDNAIDYHIILNVKERMILLERNIKDKLANSPVIAKYFEKSNHSNKGIKVIKRVVYLPYLLFGRSNESVRRD